MALSEYERRQLDEMETALQQDDPGFAVTISIDGVRRRRILLATVFILGIVVLVSGLVATAEIVLVGVLISTAGFGMMVAAATVMLRHS